MKTNNVIVVEQYISWIGHYKQYFDNLVSEKYNYLYCAERKYDVPNSIFLTSTYKNKAQHSFFNFIRGRFVDSARTYLQLSKTNDSLAHLIELEPFSLIYILLIKEEKIPRLIITIHSVSRMKYENWLKDSISLIQRKAYRYLLKKLAKKESLFITHYEHHKEQLLSLIGTEYKESIKVIKYPCPKIRLNTEKKDQSLSNKFLIYGQIREDKGIFEFLSEDGIRNLHITIAGRVLDERILKLDLPNLTIINQFLTNEELELLIDSHKFMLLPYSVNYTGGAGTLKDSLSFGLPVIASNIPIFNEVINEGKVGFIFKEVIDILNFANSVNEEQYLILSNNCIKYAQSHSWEYMQEEYFKIYDSLISMQKKNLKI